MNAALGLRAHSGWAAALLVAGSFEEPVVLDRRWLVLADENALAGAKQPYHAMEGRRPAEVERLHAQFVADAQRRAAEELRRMVDEARVAGRRVDLCGLLVASGRPLPELSAILASHALIHTADGVHFREALVHAALALSLEVRPVRERDVEALAAETAGFGVAKVRSRIGALGKTLGPPWTADQKLAALAGLLALLRR